mgnify:CR=1 FL=1
MITATKPSPFNVGDHVRYVGSQEHELPAGQENGTEPVLVPGMEGVILLSSGPFSEQSTAQPTPWQCRVQFENGFQVDITPENVDEFEANDPEAAAR